MSEFQNGATYELIKEYILCKNRVKSFESIYFPSEEKMWPGSGETL